MTGTDMTGAGVTGTDMTGEGVTGTGPGRVRTNPQGPSEAGEG